MIIRVGIGIIFCVGALVLPWWLFLLFGAALVLAFNNFYEFPLAAFFLDILYNAPSGKFFGFRFALTLLASFILAAMLFLRHRLKTRLYV